MEKYETMKVSTHQTPSRREHMTDLSAVLATIGWSMKMHAASALRVKPSARHDVIARCPFFFAPAFFFFFSHNASSGFFFFFAESSARLIAVSRSRKRATAACASARVAST